LKPEAGIGLTEAEVVAAVIANWIKLSRTQIADVPGLQTTINDRLMYSVMRRLQNQVLSGDGTGENLTGILNTTGIGEIPFSATPPLTDLALDGIVGVLVADAVPDAVAVNPVDWGTMLRAREGANTGQRLDGSGAFGTPPVTMWGLPAVPTTGLPQGEARAASRRAAACSCARPCPSGSQRQTTTFAVTA
jgi:HK97 family phage major capsid protein